MFNHKLRGNHQKILGLHYFHTVNKPTQYKRKAAASLAQAHCNQFKQKVFATP